MRIRGRTIRPSTLAERRLMTAFGVEYIHCPRNINPFILARRFRRAAALNTPDHRFLKEVIERSRPWPTPEPSPEPDTSGLADRAAS